LKYFNKMQPECWPCICMIAKLEHVHVKGCWFSKNHLFIFSSINYNLVKQVDLKTWSSRCNCAALFATFNNYLYDFLKKTKQNDMYVKTLQLSLTFLLPLT
jgi:hypothetical protein